MNSQGYCNLAHSKKSIYDHKNCPIPNTLYPISNILLSFILLSNTLNTVHVFWGMGFLDSGSSQGFFFRMASQGHCQFCLMSLELLKNATLINFDMHGGMLQPFSLDLWFEKLVKLIINWCIHMGHLIMWHFFFLCQSNY